MFIGVFIVHDLLWFVGLVAAYAAPISARQDKDGRKSVFTIGCAVLSLLVATFRALSSRWSSRWMMRASFVV